MKTPIALLSVAVAVLGIYLALKGLDVRQNKNSIILNFTRTFNHEKDEHAAFAELFRSISINESDNPRKASLEYCFENFNSIEFNIAKTSEVDQLSDLIRMGIGSFIIKCKDGQEVNGNFEGFADQSTHKRDVMIYLSIEGGTGKFERSSGYLNVKIDHLHTKSNEGVISIQGKINLNSCHEYQNLTSLQ